MSSLYQRESFQNCPQCNVMIPLNMAVCSNCGLRMPPLPPESVAQQGSSLGIRKNIPPPPVTGVENAAQQGSSLGIRKNISPPPIPTMLNTAQPPSTPGIPGMPYPMQYTPTPNAGSAPSMPGMPYPMQYTPMPNATQAPSMPYSMQHPPISTMPNAAPMNSASGPAQSPQLDPSLAIPKIKKELLQAKKQNRTTLIYFTSVFLVIIVCLLAAFHAAGVSLSALTSLNTKVMTTPTVAYTTPKGSALFTDTFVNDASGWDLQSAPGNYAISVTGGALTMEIDKNKLLWEMLPGQISYSDFTLTLDATLSQGDPNNGYGVYIRGTSDKDSDLATYYRFELYGDASYAIFKGDGNSTKSVGYVLNSAIQKQGKTNHIMIIARGTSMLFIVNGQLLKAFSDQSYTSGSIALFASNLPQAKPGIQVQFSQLAIYPSAVAGRR